MNNDLIARYIYAVVRHLPRKIRGDVEKELDGLIADMLSQRCGDILPTEKDVRVVLTELGNPEEMAAKYSGDENKSLISGTYYLIYKRVLSVVLPIAAAGIAFASILTLFLEWQPGPNSYAIFWNIIGRIIGGIISGSIQAFAVITLVFAIMERKKVNFNDGDMLSHLPPVPKENAQIKPHEPIIDIMWSIFAAVFLLGFPQLAGAWLEGVGWIPVFDTAVIRGFWLPIILWAVLGIAKAATRLTDGQYTKRLAVVTLAANILTIASAAVVFLNKHIINRDFLAHINDLVIGDSAVIASKFLGDINIIIFCIVCFTLVLETVITTVKMWKNKQYL